MHQLVNTQKMNSGMSQGIKIRNIEITMQVEITMQGFKSAQAGVKPYNIEHMHAYKSIVARGLHCACIHGAFPTWITKLSA